MSAIYDLHRTTLASARRHHQSRAPTFAGLQAVARGTGRATGEAMVDPVLTIDPNFGDAALFSLEFSDGIANVAETSATPLPAALPLFGSGFAALGLLGWRRKKKAAALAA